VWPEAYCFCPVRPCMCASIRGSQNIVNMISCRVFDTFSPNLHQCCTVWQRWTLQILGSAKVKVTVKIQYGRNSTPSFHNSSGQRLTILNNLASIDIHLVCLYFSSSYDPANLLWCLVHNLSADVLTLWYIFPIFSALLHTTFVYYQLVAPPGGWCIYL